MIPAVDAPGAGDGSAARRIVVIGAGGFGREVLDVIEDITATGADRYRIVGVVDRRPEAKNLARLADRGVRYLGDDDKWLPEADADCFAIGIGDPATRRRLAARYAARGLTAATLIHPSALIGRRTLVGAGTIICAGVVLSTNVRLGEQVQINPHATIGHDVRLDDHVSVNPGAIISGEVRVGGGTLVGAGAVVLENRRIGAGCVIGASACVTRDVPAGSVVKGIPAR